jgi:3-phosphoshikimate 1-carboxyvinyltransferase
VLLSPQFTVALPSLIEIVPPARLAAADVTIPGSKSITNRALILAALAEGTVCLERALWSEDTEVMVDCLRRLSFRVDVRPDPDESANRRIEVMGLGGQIPPGGTREAPLELFVGNAGTAARFLTALVCLGRGFYRLSGVPRMHQRPQSALLQALRTLGYSIEAPGDHLPAVIEGQGSRPGPVAVSVDQSSQFASALLLSGSTARWDVVVTGANVEELPYVEMTRRLIEVFPRQGGTFLIEPDASSGSYFWAAGHLGQAVVHVRHWPTSGWQVDARFPGYLPLPVSVSRERDLGDSIMTAIVLAPFASAPVAFTELGRLRVQECERVLALRTELLRCGARVEERGDTLTVWPGTLHGATVATYQDHRMAMCFATLGLKVPGIRLENPSCVKKTFPNFFQKLAAPAPEGMGVQIREAVSGRVLFGSDLLPD